jgi:predicted Zn-ribbon and HTH transcriptional regulator
MSERAAEDLTGPSTTCSRCGYCLRGVEGDGCPECARIIADESLAIFLADRDEGCPKCGYTLRGLKLKRCPECSERLVLRVGLADLHDRSYIAGMVGLAAGAGYFAFSLLRDSSLEGMLSFREYLQWLIPLSILGGALWIWLCSARRIRRFSDARVGFLVAGCWLGSVLLVIGTVYVRWWW